MPGRGRFWGRGDLNDEIVEEADLTQELQTKVNAVGGGGSGNLEKILDVTVASDLILHTFNFDRSIAMDGTDVGKVEVVISNIQLSASDIVDIQFNGEGFGGPTVRGVTSNGTTVTVLSSSAISDDVAVVSGDGLTIIIELPGFLTSGGGTTGVFGKWSDRNHFSSGAIDLQTNTYNPLVSFQIRTRNGIVTINTGTKIVAYAYNKD